MTKLTILLPTYNSISRNGDGIIQQALDSLLAQTFSDFEIHILDNISTDKTPKICQEYANKDERIKFKIDSKQRFPEGGINKLAENVNSEYLMIANCDDLWNHHYIEELLSGFNKGKKVDCVYSNGNFINMSNQIEKTLIPDLRFTYTNNIPLNFCLAVEHRNVIPVLFGIFKTKAYQSALPYKPFDSLKANVDNLFLFKYLLNGNKAKLHNKDLFYYRNRSRSFNISKFPELLNSPILVWVFYILHQLNFYFEVKKYLPENNPLLKLVLIDSHLRYIPNTIRWIINDLNPDPFETSILADLYKRYSYINKLLLKNSYPEFTKELCEETCKKIRIFKNTIVQHIYDIMQQHEYIDDMIQKTDLIYKEFKGIENE